MPQPPLFTDTLQGSNRNGIFFICGWQNLERTESRLPHFSESALIRFWSNYYGGLLYLMVSAWCIAQFLGLGHLTTESVV
jgi:hypothetical protein